MLEKVLSSGLGFFFNLGCEGKGKTALLGNSQQWGHSGKLCVGCPGMQWGAPLESSKTRWGRVLRKYNLQCLGWDQGMKAASAAITTEIGEEIAVIYHLSNFPASSLTSGILAALLPLCEAFLLSSQNNMKELLPASLSFSSLGWVQRREHVKDSSFLGPMGSLRDDQREAGGSAEHTPEHSSSAKAASEHSPCPSIIQVTHTLPGFSQLWVGGPGAITQYLTGQRLLLGSLVCEWGACQATTGASGDLFGAGQRSGELSIQPECSDAVGPSQPPDFFPGGLLLAQGLVLRLRCYAAGDSGGRNSGQPYPFWWDGGNPPGVRWTPAQAMQDCAHIARTLSPKSGCSHRDQRVRRICKHRDVYKGGSSF